MSEIVPPHAPPNAEKSHRYERHSRMGYDDYWSGLYAQTSALFIKVIFSASLLIV